MIRMVEEKFGECVRMMKLNMMMMRMAMDDNFSSLPDRRRTRQVTSVVVFDWKKEGGRK